MTSQYQSQDERSREAIVHDIDKNLFVEAGAGSGKTTMLVNRMVAMIEDGIPVEKICAITFTKNAALEFYERFQAKLIDRANPDNSKKGTRAGDLSEPTNMSRQRCLQALENIDLCFMGTIDSFCNMILSEHPSVANIPSDARLINEQEASEIYKQFFLDTRSGKYGKELQELAKRFNMLYWQPEEMYGKLMSEIMDRRNINFEVNDDLCIDFFKCFSNVREDTKKVLTTFNKDLSKLSNSLGSQDTRDPMDAYLKANEVLQKGWHYNFTGVIRAIKDISNVSYSETPDSLGFTNESIVRKQDTRTVLNVKDEENPDALYYKLLNYKYQNTLKFLLASVKDLEELMRKEGKFTYFDYLFYLRNMLVKDASKGGKLIDYIYKRHSYFLIDEFQDTNPMQAEVFFYLTSKEHNKDAWWKCTPKPGSLFIVGDPKQSIYRFRNADVASYLKVKELFNNNENSKVLYLVNNFRSKNVMKEYFNSVFEKVMAEESSDQSKYLDIENINTPEQDEFKGIYTYETYADSLLKDYPEMEDSKRLALIVKSLVKNPKTKILGEDHQLRNIEYQDFMIIFSAKKAIAPCIKEFKKQDIPIRVEGKVLFEECEGLKVVYKLYKAISDKNDVIGLVSALFSPVFGFNDNDLAKYKANKNDLRLDLNKEYNNTPIESALTKLANTNKKISKLTPSALFELILDEYEIFKYVSCEGLEIVYYTLELIRSKEIDGSIITFEDAIKFMDELLAGETDQERCLSLSQNINAVHIANLHKVKGLEAPIVILAKAGNANNNPSYRITYQKDEAKGHIIAISDKKNELSFTPIIETNEYKDDIKAEKESLKKEGERLVYVAATRARNVLIVSEPYMNGRSGIQRMANKWKVLREEAQDNLFNVIEENNNVSKVQNEKVDADTLYKEAETFNLDYESSYKLKQASDIKQETKLIENPLYESNGIISTLIGSMVHSLLEIIIMSKDQVSKDQVIKMVLNEYLTPSEEEKRIEYQEKLVKVYEKMHQGGYKQKGNVKEDILKVILQADKVYSEVPFTYKNENILMNGIIDLIYQEGDSLHIIDWKTNKDDENLDEHYKDQLQVYQKAVKDILGKDIEDALIYHIDLNN